MAVSISEISERLSLSGDIWYSDKKTTVSYPESGNHMSFELEEKGFWFPQRNKILLKIINRYCAGRTFFDIGGGNGYVTKCLIDSEYHAYLLEPGSEGIENARERGVSNLICSSLEDASFKSDTIPNAGLFDVLEHIEDDKGFLKLLHEKLQPSGLLFITVPAYGFLWSGDDIFAGHYRRYNVRSLYRLMNDSGFRIIYSGYFFSFLVPAIFLFKTLPWFFSPGSKNGTPGEGHVSGNKLINKLLKLFMDIEFRIISSKHRIFFGSSCIMVARKK